MDTPQPSVSGHMLRLWASVSLSVKGQVLPVLGLAWASPRESQGARGGRNQRPGQEVNPKSQEPGGGPSPPWPGLWDLTHTWGCLEAERQPQGLPGREGGVRCALV